MSTVSLWLVLFILGLVTFGSILSNLVYFVVLLDYHLVWSYLVWFGQHLCLPGFCFLLVLVDILFKPRSVTDDTDRTQPIIRQAKIILFGLWLS